MLDILEKIVNLIKAVQEMSGGRKRGQAVFWITFTIVVALALDPAYKSVSSVVSQLGAIPILSNAIIATFMTLLALIAMFGAAAALGYFIGLIIRQALATRINNRIDNIFAILLPLLKTVDKNGIDNHTINKILTDTEKLYDQWNSSRITRFTRWLYKKPQKETKKIGNTM